MADPKLSLLKQPTKDDNTAALRDWPNDKVDPDKAQKVMSLTANVAQFSGEKHKFNAWWSHIYSVLRMKKINHHILAKYDIPPAGNDADENKELGVLSKRERENNKRFLVTQRKPKLKTLGD